MSQLREEDPAIKLFGSDIPIHFTDSQHSSLTQIQHQPIIIIMNGPEESTNAEVSVPLNENSGKQADANGIPDMYQSPTPKPATKGVHRTNEHKTGKRDIDQQEKVLKKPDKVLPCPRCNSLETKFCYFNNYNVNQPRHFCKNCQRYWTAGGTIRNVPVGAGKRKSKPSALQYCQGPTDSNPASDKQLSSSIPIPSPREEAPLSESLETMLNLKGPRKIEVDCSTIKDETEEEPCSSTVRVVDSREKEYSENGIEQIGSNSTQQCNGLIPFHSLHYYPAPPWTYQWNHPCWNAMAFRPGNITSDPNPTFMDSATMMAVPGFSTVPTIEVPVAPSSYWGCMPSWAGQNEDFSLVGSAFNGIPSPSSSATSGTCSGNRSPTLGKHCRDGNTPAEDTPKPNNLWVPKTLRINDPEEAAKSSIWTTLGIKPEQNKPIMKGSVFKSFEPKSNGNSHSLDDNQILRANPAAFSRSESFQESV